MQQTWTINGKTFTHAQLMELKKRGLDPRKAEFTFAEITKPNLAKKNDKQKAKNKVNKLKKIEKKPEITPEEFKNDESKNQ